MSKNNYDVDEAAERSRANVLKRGNMPVTRHHECVRCGEKLSSHSVIVLNDMIEAHGRGCDPNYSSRYYLI